MIISKKKFENMVHERMSEEMKKALEQRELFNRIERLENRMYEEDDRTRRGLVTLDEKMAKRIEALEDRCGIERKKPVSCPLEAKQVF